MNQTLSNGERQWPRDVRYGRLLFSLSCGAFLGSVSRPLCASAQEMSGSTLAPNPASEQDSSTRSSRAIREVAQASFSGSNPTVVAPQFSGNGTSKTAAEVNTVAKTSIAQAMDEPSDLSAGESEVQSLKIPARFSVNHTSSQAGFDGITGLGGFLPIRQTPGENVTFLEGDLLLDNGGHFGWNLSLGYRGINQEGETDRLRGGFIGLDSHFTDESNFYQLAAGYESLGKDWDFRMNGYLPLGKRKNTIQDIDIDTGLQTATAFQGNQLVLSAVRDRQRILQEEEALGGFDAEVATQLSEWDGGELVGAVGGYLLTGEETSLGGQLRLSTTFASNFNAGIALQHDGIFGTNLAFSIGATFPQVRFQKKKDREFQDANEVPIRLRDPLQRRQMVAVQERTQRENFSEQTIEPLRNPEEEQDYRFVHVTLGNGGGDGTAEAPFGTVADAVALINSDPATFSDGNTIVYVDGEAAPGTAIPAFAVPERVRVLSQGPQQTIAGMPFPGFPATQTRLPFSAVDNFNTGTNAAPNANGIAVGLPNSGDGVFPVITGGAGPDLVTLGDRTVLAGFQLQNAPRNGVAASNVNNVELRNNSITGSGANGVFLDNVGGSVTMFDNQITGSGDRGILAQNTTTQQSVDISIAGYELANNRVGMEFSTTARSLGPEVPSQIIAIGPSSPDNTSVGNPSGAALNNVITNSTAEGIIVSATGDALLTSSSQEFSFDQGTIDGSGDVGLRVSANVGAHVQEINVTDSRITNSGGDGIDILNGTPPNGATQTASSQEIVIRNSTVSGNAGAGIDINVADASSQELVIRGNQITNNTGDGISSLAQNVSIQEWRNDATTGDIGASENVITGNGGQGIDIDAQDLAALPVVGVVQNQVTGNGVAPDIEIATTTTPANPGSPTACLVMAGNQVSGNIQLTGLSTVVSGGVPSFQVQDLPNVVANNNNATVTLASNLLGTITAPDATPFEDEAGNCIN